MTAGTRHRPFGLRHFPLGLGHLSLDLSHFPNVAAFSLSPRRTWVYGPTETSAIIVIPARESSPVVRPKNRDRRGSSPPRHQDTKSGPDEMLCVRLASLAFLAVLFRFPGSGLSNGLNPTLNPSAQGA